MTYDAIIIGAGAMGSAAAWQLGRRGKRVLAIDSFAPPHGLGSSHGHTRMTRTAYYENADYVPLLLRAHGLWRELEAGTGERLLEMCGGLYVGSETSELIAGSARAAREHGLAHEMLSGGELRRQFPQFAGGSGTIGAVGLLEKEAGYLLVERCVGALVHAALSNGVELKVGERVIDVDERKGRVEVRTKAGVYEAGHAIVCAGAWTTELLRRSQYVEPEVVPTRQVMGWFWPREAERFAGIPVWAFDLGGGDLLYGFPMLADRPGLKAAIHARGPVTDPNEVDRVIHSADEEAIREQLRRFVPLAADGPMLHATTCLYENSADGHFLVGKATKLVTFAAGFSGHGFKFAPVIGEVLADLALTGSTPHAISFLSPARLYPKI